MTRVIAGQESRPPHRRIPPMQFAVAAGVPDDLLRGHGFRLDPGEGAEVAVELRALFEQDHTELAALAEERPPAHESPWSSLAVQAGEVAG